MSVMCLGGEELWGGFCQENGAPQAFPQGSLVRGGVGVALHQVFVGSCCGGRLSDLREAADVLRGHSVRRGVRMVVTPASQRVYQEALEEGVIRDLVDAGVMVTASACGACGGIDKGILGAGEVCVSTSNRNFRGRMGSVDARIWLASARTAAACALTGHITDPRAFS